MSLLHHVCTKATGLESLFLISKSNCAFANFKDEPSCVAAQHSLHDSVFQSVRLVSRVRRSTAVGASSQPAPTVQAVPTVHEVVVQSDTRSKNSQDDDKAISTVQATVIEPRASSSGGANRQGDRFFILKSLTVEDLELSVRKGIWAVQFHNEEVLSDAFKVRHNF